MYIIEQIWNFIKALRYFYGNISDDATTALHRQNLNKFEELIFCIECVIIVWLSVYLIYKIIQWRKQ